MNYVWFVGTSLVDMAVGAWNMACWTVGYVIAEGGWPW